MRNVSAHDAKARFGQLLDTARREPVVTERHGRPVAVVVSKEAYDELNDIRLQQLRAEIDLGLADLEHGAYTDYQADDLPKLAERINAAGRQNSRRQPLPVETSARHQQRALQLSPAEPGHLLGNRSRHRDLPCPV
ncbi:type II toxin-antitoxin system Phd/YefM family antitoxin [Thiocapsa marina]|uniref:Antitoxin n=1 Tax=Thiocapsa marina 5811 TaxID=768671 RepID=F9U8A1_9GAMM|nr:type II toxin-antitoxin system Phd/YefM family antitoxin [Thiocapsa marina]EGV19513.1 prevent-host-death family protein [Thiocapsa marina 5811]